MKNKEKDLKNRILQIKVKEMIKKSKEKNLIKPHTKAFEDFPVENEVHKGRITSFYR